MSRPNSIRWLPVFLVLALLLAGSGQTVLADTPPFQPWHTETVDVQHNFQPYAGRFVAVDKSGRAQMAYGGGQLYYAYNDGDGWQFEVADPRQGTGAAAALALAPDDTPVIAYADSGGGMVRLARRIGGAWTSEAITVTTGLRDLAVAVDPQGRAHVAYVAGSDLLYLHETNARWELAARRPALVVPGDFFALDSAGRPHLVVAGLAHEWLMEDGWHSEQINAWADKGISLAASPDGKVAVASLWTIHHTGGEEESVFYFGYLTGGAPAPTTAERRSPSRSALSSRLATRRLAAGTVSWVDPGFPRLIFAPNGVPHILQPNGIHSYLDPSGWVSENVRGNAWDMDEICALAMNATGDAWVGCLGGTLQAYRREAERWMGELVDDARSRGEGVSLAIGSGGEPQLAYGRRLTRYANRTSTGWQVDSLPTVPYYAQIESGAPVLALGLDNAPNIALSPLQVGTGLWYKIHGRWEEQLVAPDKNLDRDCIRCVDHVTDSQGQPHLAYFDLGHSQVLHAWREDGVWRSEVASSFGALDPVPGYLSLRLSADGTPHIVYDLRTWTGEWDYRPGPLRHAVRVEGKWVTEDVSPTPSGEHALAVDSNGAAVITFTAEKSLMLARRAAHGWQSESLAEQGLPSTLTHPALAVDAAGVVHLTAYDSAAKALYYLRNKDGRWESFLVDPQGGPESAIGLDPNGRVQIAYPNRATGAVQWATGEPTRIWLPQIVRG